MDEQEHSAGAEPAGPHEGGGAVPQPDGATAPLAVPEAAGQRPGRGAAARRALTSRGAGWVVAALLAGVIIGLSVSFAQSSPTAVMVPAGVARSFTIGPVGGPQRAITVGPGGGVQRTIVVGPGGLPLGAVVAGPGAAPPKAVVIGPAGGKPVPQPVPSGAVQVVVPPGALKIVAPPGGPVRVMLPAKASWRSVNGRIITLPAGARVQVPANWTFLPGAALPPGVPVQVRPGMVVGVPAQVLVPPGQVRANLRFRAPAGYQIVLPGRAPAACQGGNVLVPACLSGPQSSRWTIP